MNKIKLSGICILALAVSFAFGRYSVKSVEVKTDIAKSTDKDVERTTTTTTTKLPSGETTTSVTVKDETRVKTDTRVIKETVVAKRSTLSVSALVGASNFDISRPVYGASVTKEVLGPVTLGIFGLNNGIVGISVGVNF